MGSGRRETHADGVEGIAILLAASVAVLSVVGGVLVLIARFTGGADDGH